ncbi:MAG: hypothetical protein M1812_004470 [Candelaria pacifica]|nr:MAG: hypothetical protein M1812_004470 [Candelaria pacifica]
MASSKEVPHPRPVSQHRLSASSAGSAALPVRQSTSRNHSHSASVGSLNPTHRVTRRKSMSSTAAGNVAAMAAAVKESGDGSFIVPPSSNRRSAQSKPASGPKSVDSTSSTNAGPDNHPPIPSSFPNNAGEPARIHGGGKSDRETSVFVDENSTSTSSGLVPSSTKSRVRRASEGAHLVKGDGKRESGGELRWEHTPEWLYTSKLLISKHQQVQLLEAASVLVAMNQEPTEPVEPSKVDSGNSSASPAASGYSELQDMSSADTTPPPQMDEADLATHLAQGPRHGRTKRYSSNSSGYSRSYQSAPSGSGFAGSAPNGSAGFSHYHQARSEGRPSTSGVDDAGRDTADEDEASLAAAVELLSCSFGTPRSGPVMLSPDVPPVPPLPARFLEQNQGNLGTSAATPTARHTEGLGSKYSHHLSNDDDVKMESEGSMADDDEHMHRSTRDRNDDYDDEGVFGRMEE